MAKAKVTVGFYTATRYNSDYSAGTVFTEEQFEELVKERTEQLREEKRDFDEYLSNIYSYQEIFDMNENEKVKIRQDYENRCEDWARDELEQDWDYNELKAEVEVPAEVPFKQPKCKCPCPCNQ